MKLFSVDLLIAATAYIKADTEEEAREKIAALAGEGIELSTDSFPDTDLAICGRSFENMGEADVADVTLSPAMTVHGAWSTETLKNTVIGDDAGLDEIHEFSDAQGEDELEAVA